MQLAWSLYVYTKISIGSSQYKMSSWVRRIWVLRRKNFSSFNHKPETKGKQNRSFQATANAGKDFYPGPAQTGTSAATRSCFRDRVPTTSSWSAARTRQSARCPPAPTSRSVGWTGSASIRSTARMTIIRQDASPGSVRLLTPDCS